MNSEKTICLKSLIVLRTFGLIRIKLFSNRRISFENYNYFLILSKFISNSLIKDLSLVKRFVLIILSLISVFRINSIKIIKKIFGII